MYKYFTAKIYDSVRQVDHYNRSSNWGSTNITSGGVVNNPNLKGVTLDSSKFNTTGDPNYNYSRVRKEIVGSTYKVNDLMIVRCKHDKKIDLLETDFYPLGRSIVSQTLNVNMGSYYESYITAKCTANGTGRMLIGVGLLRSKRVGIVKIWDCEMLKELGAYPAKPIYLSTARNVKIDGINALPHLKIPETRTRGISPADTSATASTLDFTIYNKGTTISKLIYERKNVVMTGDNPGSMLWNEKVEIWGHTTGRKDRIFMGNIKDVDNDPLETEYYIETSDIFDIIKTTLFTRELGEYKASGTIESVANINGTRLPSGFTCSTDTVDGKQLKKITYSGHPLDFIFGIFQTIFSTPTNLIGYSWLGVDYLDFLDIDSFENVSAGLSSSYSNNFTFTFYKPLDDPFEFIKEQIFKPCVIFPFITLDGKLGIKFHQQPLSTSGVNTLDETKIMSISKKKNSMDDFINHISIDYNLYKDRKDEYYTNNRYDIYTPGLNKTRFLSPKGEALKFELEGINFGGSNPVDQDIIVRNIFDSYFNRYGDSITVIEIETTMSMVPNLTVGDYIGLQHRTLIDWVPGRNEGERGLSGTIDPGDPNAYLNNGDVWSGFVNNNNLGNTSNNHRFLNTHVEEIRTDLFIGNSLSCKTNQAIADAWLKTQGY